jgi:hypothetical protein
MSFFGDISNEEFKRQALVIKNSQSSAWDALNLNDYCRNMSYGGNKKDIKYIEEKISKYLASPLLDNFANIDNIDLQGSTIATNMLLMPNADINYIIASMFKDKINIILNLRGIQIEDADIIYLRDIIYLQDTDSADSYITYLHRMNAFITQWHKKDLDCPLYKFYKNKSIILSYIDLSEYKDFLLKHIIKIDIYSYWDTYFRDIEFYQMAIILIANKIHYDILCKKYEITPYEDGGISFLLESFSDESFNIFSKEVESDFALLRL